MHVYEFVLEDDLLGHDIVEDYISDASLDTVQNLWDMSKGKTYKERVLFISHCLDELGFPLNQLKIDKSFSMS